MRALRVAALPVLLSLMLVSCSAQPDAVESTDGVTGLIPEADQRWANVLARYPDAERPEVTAVRTVQPDEWAGVQQECLKSKGFDVAIKPDGRIESSIAVEQGEPYSLAEYECALMYPLDRKYTDPLSRDMLRYLYAYQTGELTQCLEGLGYTVGAAPSEEIYIQNYYTEDNWSPYGTIGQLDDEVLTQCPEIPDLLWDQR